ncbi:MAG TPA: hypothetical protein VGT41_00240 [Candidatus Babeliales bacterium]|nr:hypothetical protein [Candidatus Babeliales bacterium]
MKMVSSGLQKIKLFFITCMLLQSPFIAAAKYKGEWLAIPGTDQAVFYDKQQKVYINGDENAVLPHGLFLWKSMVNEQDPETKDQYYTTLCGKPDIRRTWTRDPEKLEYVDAYKNSYNPQYYQYQTIELEQMLLLQQLPTTAILNPTINLPTMSPTALPIATTATSTISTTQTATPSVAQPSELTISNPVICLDRNKLFENIMGMNENRFKEQFKRFEPQVIIRPPSNPDSYKPSVSGVQQFFYGGESESFFKANPRARSVIQGELIPFISLWYLRKKIATRLTTTENPIATGTLELIAPPEETDIRRLHELFPGAFFMVSTNFNTLTIRMTDFAHNLNEMNLRPMQGEEAALATMGATIYRRYCVRRINLLAPLYPIFTMQGFTALEQDQGVRPLIIGKKDQKKPLTKKDMQGFTVALHKNIVVTSGASADLSAPDRKLIPSTEIIPACNKQMPTQGPGTITVSHIFTSPFDLSSISKENLEDTEKISSQYSEQVEIAQAVLDAAYELTILTAMDHGAKQLILPMLGTRLFKNNPEWIINSLTRLIPLIALSNIDIKIVLRLKNESIETKIKQLITKIGQYKTTGKPLNDIKILLNPTS